MFWGASLEWDKDIRDVKDVKDREKVDFTWLVSMGLTLIYIFLPLMTIRRRDRLLNGTFQWVFVHTLSRGRAGVWDLRCDFIHVPTGDPSSNRSRIGVVSCGKMEQKCGLVKLKPERAPHELSFHAAQERSHSHQTLLISTTPLPT